MDEEISMHSSKRVKIGWKISLIIRAISKIKKTTPNTHLIFLLDKLKKWIEKINVKLKWMNKKHKVRHDREWSIYRNPQNIFLALIKSRSSLTSNLSSNLFIRRISYAT